MLPSGLRVVSEQMRPAGRSASAATSRVGSRHETRRPARRLALPRARAVQGHPADAAPRRSPRPSSPWAVTSTPTRPRSTPASTPGCSTADAELAVDVLTDMITCSLVLGRRRRRRAGRDPGRDRDARRRPGGGRSQELVTAEIFGDDGPRASGHRLGRRRSTAMTRAQIVRHWRRHYRPATIVVAAAGHVDHDRLVEQLGSIAGRLRRARAAARRPTRCGRDRRRGHRGPTGSSSARPCWRSRPRRLRRPALPARPAVGDPRRRHVLPAVRGGARAARADATASTRARAAYSDAGLWTVDWQCAPDKLPEITDPGPRHPRRRGRARRHRGRARPRQGPDAGPDHAGVRGPVQPDEPARRQRPDR